MTINYPFDSMQHGTILGTVHKFSPGGEAIIVLSDEGNGNEVVFEEAEARAVYAWLGRALSAAQETSALCKHGKGPTCKDCAEETLSEDGK